MQNKENSIHGKKVHNLPSKLAKRRVKSRKKKTVIYDALIALCVVVMFISAAMIYDDLAERAKAKSEIQDLQEIKPIPSIGMENLSPSFANLKEINSDYIGWLEIEGTMVDLPVVQCHNNDYYLKVTFKDEVNGAGCLFLDYVNDPTFLDQNSVIYGHAMLDGTMFGGLKKFKDQAYYEQHPFITLVLENTTYYYQIVSVNVLDASYDYRSPSYGNGITDFMASLRSSSYISSSAPIDVTSHILTLSTCTGNDGVNRLAVFAVLLNQNGEQVDFANVQI